MAFLMLNVVLILVIPLAATAQTYKNLTSGSSITAGDPSTYLLSPSGEFAFGFQDKGSGFILSVWFEKIVEKTIVWSANGDKPGPKGSNAQLTGDGRLLVADPHGASLSSLEAGSGLAYASLLDTGNLVLSNQGHTSIWDSFSQPTDTLLPTQTLGRGSQLVARYSETNYSGGRFALVMGSQGNLRLSTTAFPLQTLNADYWMVDTNGTGYQLVFDLTGDVKLTAVDSRAVIKAIHSSSASADDFYQRAVIEHDGVFRQYIYPKTLSIAAGRPMAWSMTSLPIPENICTSIRQATGSGACGFNSYCILGEDQRPKCECPKGYILLDPDDETKGCKPGFTQQSCDKDNPEEDKFILHEIIYVHWPDTDYALYPNQSENWCRQACLADCFCAVAIYNAPNCWKKRIPLSNGRADYGNGRKALIKIRINNSSSTVEFPGDGEKRKLNSTVKLVGLVLISGSVSLNLLLFAITCLICRRLLSLKTVSQEQQSMDELGELRQFTYEELHKATDGLKEELGRGAFGAVYKGFVPSSSGSGGHSVAVKVLDKLTAQGDSEFKREISTISRTNHKNLVKLVGYCNENHHRLLVYEYMSNSCLANILFGVSRPSWYKRIEIGEGVARGLSYLHDECGVQIIHCDIKPQNVLLDDALRAKISDFGLAKLLMTDQTRTLTELRGTKGYVAPEWFKNMPISAKVDVYSFGMLLLELICCRKNYDENAADETERTLADRVYECYREGNLDVLVENDPEALGDKRRVERLVRTALWCIQEDPSLRPTMKKVTLMLEGAAQVPVPPDPCLSLWSD